MNNYWEGTSAATSFLRSQHTATAQKFRTKFQVVCSRCTGKLPRSSLAHRPEIPEGVSPKGQDQVALLVRPEIPEGASPKGQDQVEKARIRLKGQNQVKRSKGANERSAISFKKVSKRSVKGQKKARPFQPAFFRPTRPFPQPLMVLVRIRPWFFLLLSC